MDNLRSASLRFPLRPTLGALTALATGSNLSSAASTPAPTALEAAPPDEVTELERLEIQEQNTQKLASPKISTPLRDLPQTVTVIPQSLIEDQGATSLRDVLRNTPGITFQAGEGGTAGGDQFTVRGFEARTDILVDGIRDAGTYTRDSFNLEQVEVAKGPSSSISGRGSTGATVNLVTKTPKNETFRHASAGIGSHDYYRSTLDINESLPASPIAGTAVRLNALWQDSGVAGRDEVENKTWAVAPSLALGLGTDTRGIIAFQHIEQDNLPDYGLPWAALDTEPVTDQSNWYGLLERDYEKVVNDTLTARIDRDLSADATLTNTFRFGRTSRDSVTTAPRILSGTTDVVRRDDWKSRDQIDDILANNLNLALSLRTGAVDHAINTGLELSRERSTNYTRAYPAGVVYPTTDLADPDPTDAFPYELSRTGAFTDGEGRTLAVYLFDTASIGEHWQISGGLRWDRYAVDYRGYTPATSTAAEVDSQLSRTDKMLSWKAGLVYKPRANGSIYAGVGTSFNPSAESLALSDGTGRSPSNVDTPPEESRSYEIGTKWDFFQNRLSLTGALFRTEKTDARVTDPTDSTRTILAGDQQVQGVELGISGKITPAWDIFAGYAYMDSEIKDSSTASEVGAALARTPANTFNLWSSYRLPFGLTLGGGAQFMDEVNRSTTDATLVVDSYWLFNAMTSYEVNKHLTLRLNVNNLADKRYVDRVGGGHYIPGAARSFVLSADLSF